MKGELEVRKNILYKKIGENEVEVTTIEKAIFIDETGKRWLGIPEVSTKIERWGEDE